jgi:hypothetical protein
MCLQIMHNCDKAIIKYTGKLEKLKIVNDSIIEDIFKTKGGLDGLERLMPVTLKIAELNKIIKSLNTLKDKYNYQSIVLFYDKNIENKFRVMKSLEEVAKKRSERDDKFRKEVKIVDDTTGGIGYTDVLRVFDINSIELSEDELKFSLEHSDFLLYDNVENIFKEESHKVRKRSDGKIRKSKKRSKRRSKRKTRN